MAALLEYPVKYLYAADELPQAFNYQRDSTRFMSIRKLVLIVNMLTCAASQVYLKDLYEFSYFALWIMYIETITLAMTVLSMTSWLDQKTSKALLVRKWTHSLNSVLLFTCFWQMLLYVGQLHRYLENQKLFAGEDTFKVTLSQVILVLPFLSLLANFCVTDMLLLPRHSHLCSLLYVVFFIVAYFLNGGSLTHS